MGSGRFAAAQAHVSQLLESADQAYVSTASHWEVAVKARLGRIEADLFALADAIEASGVIELRVRAAHAAVMASLAMHHNDPFDRLLIA